MSNDRTKITELATALGMTKYPTLKEACQNRPEEIKIDATIWSDLDKIIDEGQFVQYAQKAFSNGKYFRDHPDGLLGQTVRRIEWTANQKNPGDENFPSDIIINRTIYISCKYKSNLLHNAAPARIFVNSLLPQPYKKLNWYEHVAREEYNSFYKKSISFFDLANMPDTPDQLTKSQKERLKKCFEPYSSRLPPPLQESYQELIFKVSSVSSNKWKEAFNNLDKPVRMLWRLLRIYTATYFILGSNGKNDLRIRVCTPWEWNKKFKLQSFDIFPAGGGQPQVNWKAQCLDKNNKSSHEINGIVEIRWSHGKFGGNPEAKVQLKTKHEQVPGYYPLLDSQPSKDSQPSELF